MAPIRAPVAKVYCPLALFLQAQDQRPWPRYQREVLALNSRRRCQTHKRDEPDEVVPMPRASTFPAARVRSSIIAPERSTLFFSRIVSLQPASAVRNPQAAFLHLPCDVPGSAGVTELPELSFLGTTKSPTPSSPEESSCCLNACLADLEGTLARAKRQSGHSRSAHPTRLVTSASRRPWRWRQPICYRRQQIRLTGHPPVRDQTQTICRQPPRRLFQRIAQGRGKAPIP